MWEIAPYAKILGGYMKGTVYKRDTNERVATLHSGNQYQLMTKFVNKFDTNYYISTDTIKCGVNYYLACLYLGIARKIKGGYKNEI